MGYSYAHISAIDTTTQAIAVADTPQVVTFNTIIREDKIVATSSSRFTVNETGEYLVSANTEVTASNAGKTLDLWIRVNGSDVANTNHKSYIKNTSDVEFLPVGGMVISVTAGDYIEFWISGDSTTLSMVSYAAGTTPTRPATPSISMTVQKIHP